MTHRIPWGDREGIKGYVEVEPGAGATDPAEAIAEAEADAEQLAIALRGILPLLESKEAAHLRDNKTNNALLSEAHMAVVRHEARVR